MYPFFAYAYKAAEKRHHYEKACEELREKIKQDKQNKLNELKTTVNCEKLTYNDLLEMTTNLKNEFAEIGNENVWSNDIWSEMDGIPGAITVPVDQAGQSFFIEANVKKYGHEGCYDDPFECKRPKNSTAIENYEKAYTLCLNILKDHDVKIIEMTRDPTKFKNFRRSTCCEDATSLSFKCTKDNYTFTVNYNDDCDCYPGMFMVRDLKQISPEINLKINGNCNLVSYNGDKVTTEQKDFYCLLDSPDYDSYIESRFGHFLRFPDYLREEGYMVTNPKDLIQKGSINVNDHDDYTYVLTVTDNIDTFDIVLNPEYGNDGNYWLYINPTLEEQNEFGKEKNGKYHYDLTKYDWNTFHHFDADKMHRVRVVYNSDDDFDDLLEVIEVYQNWNSGDYGFWENDQYNNETHIPKLSNVHFEGSKSMHDMFYEYEFNVYAHLHQRNLNSAYYRKHVKEMEYPQDIYGMTFSYDSSEDHCVLTIEGVWYDMTSIADKYYNKDKDFDKFTVNTIAPMFVFNGTYSECVQKITEFSKRMKEINNTFTNYDEKHY